MKKVHFIKLTLLTLIAVISINSASASNSVVTERKAEPKLSITSTNKTDTEKPLKVKEYAFIGLETTCPDGPVQLVKS